MPVVSDTSSIILLDKCALLDLLPALYGEVLIPPAVRHELTAGAPVGGLIGADWVRTRVPDPARVATELAAGLHAGEAEAIALAAQLGPGSGVVVDDLGARRRARQLGITVVGSAGVLVAAKGQGLLPAVRPALDRLVDAGLYLGDAAHRVILAASGE